MCLSSCLASTSVCEGVLHNSEHWSCLWLTFNTSITTASPHGNLRGYTLAKTLVVNCGSLTRPVNGNVSLSSGTTYPSTASYSCSPGFTLQGSSSRTCQTSGTWDGTAPSCLGPDCGPLTAPTNGNVSLSSGTRNPSTATYSCGPGYTVQGSTTRNCQSDGTWDNSAPTCLGVNCGLLPAPTNGNVSLSSGTTYPSTASYSCSPGFTLQGGTSRTCQTSGAWDGTTPSCLGADCGPLSAPTNGNVSLSSGTRYPSTATYSCGPGYSVQGSSTGTCQANGTWDNSAPTCLDKAYY